MHRYHQLPLTFIRDELTFENIAQVEKFLSDHSSAFYQNPDASDEQKVFDCRSAQTPLAQAYEEKYRKAIIKGAIWESYETTSFFTMLPDSLPSSDQDNRLPLSLWHVSAPPHFRLDPHSLNHWVQIAPSYSQGLHPLCYCYRCYSNSLVAAGIILFFWVMYSSICTQALVYTIQYPLQTRFRRDWSAAWCGRRRRRWQRGCRNSFISRAYALG